MFKLVKHRLLLDTARKTLLNDGKNLRFVSSGDSKDSSLCAVPPQPPPCLPPNVEPPPCPPPPPPCGPPCPPPICTPIPDPNNPCNYVPPANPDPDEPDMTRVKRLQCLYQRDDGIPIHLKGGKSQVYFFHCITIVGGLTFIQTLYNIITLCIK